MEMDKEEGEMSDDGMLVDDEIKPPSDDHTILYKADKSGLVIKQLEKVDASKLEERARRFGLNLTGNRVITQKQIDELYANFGIESGNERHFRFDTIHLSCIEGLSTREIFEYLQDYKPLSLECIDDTSCNIVCQDHISVALALLVHSREIKNEELKQMIANKSSHHWREGMPHPKKDFILMRFATNGDKKMPKKKLETKHPREILNQDQHMDCIKKNPWGPLCQSWGVYDHQEIFSHKLLKDDYEDNIEESIKPIHIRNKQLAMRLGKKRPVSVHSEDSDSDSEWRRKSKAPRMRMHADDEESKQKKQQMLDYKLPDVDISTYAPLSIEVVNLRSNYTPRETTKLSEKFKYHNKSSLRVPITTIRSRLGEKVVPEENRSSSDEYSSDNSDHNIMSRVQKVSNKSGSTSNVWSRLESIETNKSSSQKDLRQILKSKNKKKSEDLRERISKTKRSGLRIEIDNNYVE